MTDTTLSAEVARCQIAVSDDQIDRLEAYRALLADWNARMNLTRHLDPATFAARDILDSWHLAQCLDRAEQVLDLGTGGGVPGIILAILRPDLRVSLCESIGKKAAAVSQIVRDLGLETPVHACRAESLLATSRFDSLVMRAVGTMDTVLRWLQPHWKSFDRVLMIKGPKWTEERGAARQSGALVRWHLRRLASYRPPGHYGDSVVVQLIPDANRCAS